MARDQRRQLAASQAFAANSVISFDLPTTAVLSEINLALEFAASAAAASSLSAPFERAPWTLIKRIDLIANGGDTIKSYDGGTLVDLNQVDYGAYPPSQVADVAASGANGTTTYPLWHELTISLKAAGMKKEFNPKTGFFEGGEDLTLLDARKLQSLELKITFGAGLADIYTTLAGTTTLDLFRLTPWSHEVLDQAQGTSYAVNAEIMTQTAFPTTTATDRAFKLNVGNPYRRLIISTVDANSRVPVNRLNKLILTENGVFNRRIQAAGLLNARTHRKSLLAIGLDPANPATYARAIPRLLPVVETAQGQNAGNRRGLYVLDIAEDDRISSLLDTRGYSSLEALLSWDGSNITDLIRITSNYFLPGVR